MKRKEGIHFYINVSNFNEIVEKEEQSGNVNHSIHALDTLFSSTESFGKKYYSENFVVEKITGSRLHMYLYGDVSDIFDAVFSIVSYAYNVVKYMSCDISKYKTLLHFELQAGAGYGRFYEFEFKTSSKNDSYEEMTTIGFACNYAAKLQALAAVSSLAVSKNIYDALNESEKNAFSLRTNPSIQKYGQSVYYEAELDHIKERIELTDELKDDIRRYANKRNLTDMSFPEVTSILSMERLSVTNGRRVEGIPVFADIRDFTSKFEENDSNLPEMAQKTKAILEKLYHTTVQSGGVHIQFQGDREFALYHNIGDEKCYKKAVLGAMRMIDIAKPFCVHIGIGEAFGKIFAVRIGARGEKDNLLIGRTVNSADILEDKHAKENQIAITCEVYEGLKREDASLADLFKRTTENVYVTEVGFEAQKNQLVFNKHTVETKKRNYNGAWGKIDAQKYV